MAEAYFEKVKYRLPQHPVIEAYVRPKPDYISRVVPLRKNYFSTRCGMWERSIHLLFPAALRIRNRLGQFKEHAGRESVPARSAVRGDGFAVSGQQL